MPETSENRNNQPTGTLYVVATPIGNREDITLRALRILGQVDLIAAEDTRHTGRFLASHGVKGKLLSFHEHNEAERTPGLIAKLRQGLSIAVVSNAGTPSVSDPGYRLVRAAVAAALPVVPIPGVSAAVTALSASGLPTDRFLFVGFAARKQNKRREQLAHLSTAIETLVFYESPRRILTLLADLVALLGDRPAVLARELTKLHEEFLRGPLSELQAALTARPAVKGECTLLVQGCRAADDAVAEEDLSDALRRGLAAGDRSLSDLARDIASRRGLSKKQVYAAALKLKDEVSD